MDYPVWIFYKPRNTAVWKIKTRASVVIQANLAKSIIFINYQTDQNWLKLTLTGFEMSNMRSNRFCCHNKDIKRTNLEKGE